MMAYHNKIYLIFAAIMQVIDSLSNLSVRIPEFIQKGQQADLTCSYNLGGDTLYSVKWYKGRHEFYRYMPTEMPIIKTFPVKNMKINMSVSDQTRVVLDDIQVQHSGTYLCEVTVTPGYYALMQFANMTVVDLPDEGPVIESKGKQYQVGEVAELTCKAQKSNPRTDLSWYINGEPAHDAYTHLNETTRQLDLSFPLTTNHFVGNNNRVRLKCLASISNFYWKSTEITLLQERPKFASVMINGQEDVSAEKSEIIASGSRSISRVLQLSIFCTFIISRVTQEFILPSVISKR